MTRRGTFLAVVAVVTGVGALVGLSIAAAVEALSR